MPSYDTLLAEARGHLSEGKTVLLSVDGRDKPIEVRSISEPDGSGLLRAESGGSIRAISFYPESLIDVQAISTKAAGA